ncbi:hypothetical protein [Acetobacterium tundrae]|uniref:Tetratricopeptide repeat protein n=1 Tax=Acetobacterium tundrae TaxID=132932 RepID=A0ABR6WLM2_9FIRM|nr:hypothetical protein [Acetobacterium tundrae]MBC3797151.1 hypothetical protein [Acetobacterium tundrae]
MGLFSKINKMVAEEKQAKQALKEIEKRSIATSLAFDKIMEPINEYNKKGDQQLERLKKETQFSKETGDVQKLIEVYEDVLLNEGLCFNGKGYYINLAELYYKTGQLDKAWGYLNKIGVEHPELISKIRDFQSKVLRKEKKYQDALLFQIISLYCQRGFHCPLELILKKHLYKMG